MARGGAFGRRRAAHHDACHSDAGWTPVRPRRPSPRDRRARAYVLHQPHVSQGRRAASEPPRGSGDPLVGARPADPRRGCRRRGVPGGVCGLLGDATAREPDRRVGISAVPTARRPRRARGPGRPTRKSGSAAPPFRCRRSGAAIASGPRASSSGHTATTACTSAFDTSARTTAGCGSSWRRSATTAARGRRPCTGPPRSTACSPWRPSGAPRRSAPGPPRARMEPRS